MNRLRLSRSELYFNVAALLSLLASITIWFLGHREEALFVGLWVPSIVGWMNFFKLKEHDRKRDEADRRAS